MNEQNSMQVQNEQDALRTLEGHLHFAMVNDVKRHAEHLPDEERQKYEKRYRDHLRYMAKIALDLSMEGMTDATETSTAV